LKAVKRNSKTLKANLQVQRAL